MRGSDERSGALFSHVDLEDRVPKGHPLRAIREIVNDALGGLSSDFDGLYARIGRPSIPPEKLLRALLLQAFYSIRSERQLMDGRTTRHAGYNASRRVRRDIAPDRPKDHGNQADSRHSARVHNMNVGIRPAFSASC